MNCQVIYYIHHTSYKYQPKRKALFSNKLHPKISLEEDILIEKISFLDLKIKRGKRGLFLTLTYLLFV